MVTKKGTKVTSSTTEKVVEKTTAKKPAVKAEAVKPAVKVEAVKPAAKVEAVKPAAKVEAVKPAAKTETVGAPKASVKKETAAKASAKKPATKKEMKVRAVVEYYGKQVEEKDMIASVKKAWTKSGKKVGDIKTMELYIKPEEAAVYYVINGTDTGAVAF